MNLDTHHRKTRTVRCAIYTRKSTEEGLEQEFNTLDAQRESAENYIASQRGEGWTALPTRYDDGGYTGGNMDRPALKRLLADVSNGQVDCIVVYKVDRLSRSLMDFARIMEVLERHQVAFVSVTQQFNTNSSMGRLMLNVLLSFAQFEREMISERTRDKIAAARRKGRWVGGHPILGYDIVSDGRGGRVKTNEAEATQVRQTYQLYLQHRTLLGTLHEIDHRGWRTKQWTTYKGQVRGGQRYNKESLWRLLTNVAYIGRVRYKDQTYKAEHEAIVEEKAWQEAQKILHQNARQGSGLVRNKYGALLKGLLYCKPCNSAMIHTYTSKGNRQYRYYVCTNAQKRGWDDCPTKSIPAAEVERLVVEQIREVGKDQQVVAQALHAGYRQQISSLEALQEEARTLERQLLKWNEEIHKLVAEAGSDISRESPAAARLADLQERISTAERRGMELRAQMAACRRAIHEDEMAEALSAFDPVWDSLSAGERAQVVHLLLERVTYDGQEGKLAITFRPTGIQTLGEERKAC